MSSRFIFSHRSKVYMKKDIPLIKILKLFTRTSTYQGSRSKNIKEQPKNAWEKSLKKLFGFDKRD